jgi:iron complex transport system substrate-binding protein
MKRSIAIFFLSFFLLGCGTKPSHPPTPKAPGIAPPVPRIIALYGAHAENLAAMGATTTLIAANDPALLPTLLQSLPQIDLKQDPERFLALKPDIILIRPMLEAAHGPVLDRLKQAGIRIESLQAESLAELPEYWNTLGHLCNRPLDSALMVATWQKTLAAQKPVSASKPGTYMVAMHARRKTFAPDSIPAGLLTLAGGTNLAADAKQSSGNIAEYGAERLAVLAPEISCLVVSVGRMNAVTRADIDSDPILKASPAVKTGRVVMIDEALLARPTPRLAEGLKVLRSFLHPEEQP